MASRVENISQEVQIKPILNHDEFDSDPLSDPHIIQLADSNDNIGIYMKEIGKYPRLTHEEEIELGKRMEKGKIAHKHLHESGNSHNNTDLERDIEDGRKAFRHLISCNTRLVVSVARECLKNNFNEFDFLEAIQNGNLGLIHATEKYNYKKGFKFSTYATWWIRQSILREFAHNGRLIRIPVHQWDLNGSLMSAENKFIQKNSRKPTEEELSEVSGVSPEKIQYLRKIYINPISLDEVLPGSEDGATLGEMIPSGENTEDIIENINIEELRKVLDEVLADIPAKYERVIRHRFGFKTAKPLTLQDTGERFDVTRERIRQIEKEVLLRLRSPHLKHKFTPFLDTGHNGHKPTDRT
jgi:RNA polymerase primary sigma factor